MKRIITVLIFVSFCFSGAFSQTVDTAKFKLYMKLTGHTRNVEALAISPNGKWLASGGWDNDLRVYKLDTPNFGSEKHVLKGHVGGITSVVFSKDNQFVASSSKDRSIRVYNLETGALVFSSNDHKESVTKVVIDPKVKYAVSCSLDGTIWMYEFQNATAKPRTIKYTAPINSFVTAIDGKSMYVASSKGEIDNIDFKATVLGSLKGHAGQVNCLELSPNGKMLASGSDDKTIIIWDLVTSKPLKTLKGHEWGITSVNWSSDGNYLVSTCNDGNTKVWDLQTGKELKNLKSLGTNARSAAWTPDMGMIAVATLMDGNNRGALLYNTPLKKLPPAKPGDKGKTPPAKGTGTTTGGTGTGDKKTTTVGGTKTTGAAPIKK